MTGENEYTQLKFIACNAFTTVMEAKEKEAYEELEEVLDEFEGIRPQRHNIIWGGDGWPTNNWYSTKALRDKQNISMPQNFHNMDIDDIMKEVHSEKLDNIDVDEISEEIRDEIMDKINVDEITKLLQDSLYPGFSNNMTRIYEKPVKSMV
jgi:hypothetical protein